MPATERLYLGTGLHIQEELHLGRYRFASSRIETGTMVLDAACGSGYGSAILAQHARQGPFGLRRRVRSWRLGALIDGVLAPSHRLLEAVSPTSPGEHWWLIAVATKR